MEHDVGEVEYNIDPQTFEETSQVISTRKTVYNSAGNLVTSTDYDDKGTVTYMVTMEYDEFGNKTKVLSHGTQGNLSTQTYDYSCWKRK